MKPRHYGTDGEYEAHDYLMGQGYEILDMGYKRQPGEIDIVAQKGDTVAFIEVKRRASRFHGRPAEAVTFQKRRRIVQTAAIYMQQKGLQDAKIRFDIIEITPGEIHHIPAAFDATDVF